MMQVYSTCSLTSTWRVCSRGACFSRSIFSQLTYFPSFVEVEIALFLSVQVLHCLLCKTRCSRPSGKEWQNPWRKVKQFNVKSQMTRYKCERQKQLSSSIKKRSRNLKMSATVEANKREAQKWDYSNVCFDLFLDYIMQIVTTNSDAKNCTDILPATFVSWSAPQMIEIPLDLTR